MAERNSRERYDAGNARKRDFTPDTAANSAVILMIKQTRLKNLNNSHSALINLSEILKENSQNTQKYRAVGSFVGKRFSR